MPINRDRLITTLENYNASQYEQPIVSELLEYVKDEPNCFERIHEDDAKHIAAAVLLVNEKDEALFLWHSKIQQWTQPGGHCDGNENILDVALTELEEETGITTAKIESMPLEVRKYEYAKEVFGYSKSIYNITFLARVDTTVEEPKICEPEKCEKMTWMTKEEAFKELENSPYESPTNLIDKWMKLS